MVKDEPLKPVHACLSFEEGSYCRERHNAEIVQATTRVSLPIVCTC